MKNLKYDVTPRLKSLLVEKGYSSQKEFAQLCGLPEPTISRFDSQRRYDIYTLAVISRTLKVTMDELFYIKEIK